MPRWDHRIPSGEYEPRSKDTPQLRALKADELSLSDTRPQRILNNPYGNGTAAETPLKRRNSLDYMRALSESIKTKRYAANPHAVKNRSVANSVKRILREFLRGR